MVPMLRLPRSTSVAKYQKNRTSMASAGEEDERNGEFMGRLTRGRLVGIGDLGGVMAVGSAGAGRYLFESPAAFVGVALLGLDDGLDGALLELHDDAFGDLEDDGLVLDVVDDRVDAAGGDDLVARFDRGDAGLPVPCAASAGGG